MAFNNVIRTPKAQEIVKYILKGINHEELHSFPALQEFVKDGLEALPKNIMEMRVELGFVRHSGAKVSYDDTSKLYDYLDEFIPDEITLKIIEHYGLDRFKPIK